VHAANGLDGLDRLAKNIDVNLIIADLNMPLLDGLGFVEKLRATDIYKAIPVLIFSSEGGNEKVMEAKDKGAQGWLVKCYEPKKIIDTIERLIK